MKKLSILFIALVTFSSIEALSQDQNHTSAHRSDNQKSEQPGKVANTTNLASVANLPLNKIHFQNKGVRQAKDTRWEDGFSKEENRNTPLETLTVDHKYVAAKIAEAPNLSYYSSSVSL